METTALLVIIISGASLIGVALLMALRPRRFLHLLSLTASNWRINLVEQGLRLIAGLALIVRGEASKLPTLFHMGGWFIVASSVALLLVPLRLHAGYALWWSRKMSLASVRVIAPFSSALGVSLIYAAI